MSDRIVRQIFPKLPPEAAGQVWKFSDFANQPNIVLVGDPGAGKSHLMSEAAAADNGKLLTTRTFLNDPTIPPDSVLFIDALDEKRAGRRDQATIDAVVQKLFQLNTKKVRIACREHDWLGGTDLEAFRPYFDQHGGTFVLGLEPLTTAEQHGILSAHGVTDPAGFVKEAENRGLHEFLVNPQNLIMLIEAVSNGNWPETRIKLFESTSQLLLREHSTTHARFGSGVFTAAEIREAAGAACALRLISDVAGISLADKEGDPQIPSYRTIPFTPPERTLAALGRRSFVATGQETVDYAHRIRAEFLGAGWLAEQVEKGLPIGRVRALLGIDGVPTPELRGLHAWLTVHLPNQADALIDADPYGILIYSDAGALSLSQRKRLLEALSRVSVDNPWFRSDGRTAPAIAALSQPDMVPHFKSVLRSPRATFGLKTVVLDAMAEGTPLPALQNDLVALLGDNKAPYGLKYPALKAAIRIGTSAESALAKLYPKLGNSGENMRLRADILSRLYSKHFKPADVAKLIADALASPEELMTGILWRVTQAVPIADIPAVLNAIKTPSRRNSERMRSSGFEALHLIEGLIDRMIKERPGHITGPDLWKWFILRRSFRGAHGYYESERLKGALADQPQLIRGVFEAAMDEMPADNQIWWFVRCVSEVIPIPLNGEPLRWLTERLLQKRLLQKKDNGAKQAALYQVATGWAYSNPTETRDVFETLYAFGDTSAELAKVRDSLLSCPVEDWRREDAERRAERQQERQQGRQKNLTEFEKNAAAIKSGDHAGWLIWIGDVYFANFSDVDGEATPRTRLENELGAANTQLAIEGLKAGLQRDDVPTVDDVADASAKNSYPRWWFALIAGMDEAWADNPDLAAFPEPLLRALIAINLVLPTLSRSGNTVHHDEHPWKTAALRERPQTVRDVYVAVARRGLQEGNEHISGLHEILNDEAFSQLRGGAAIELLKQFPDARATRLEDLLGGALGASDARADLLALARDVLKPKSQIGVEQRRLWTAAAYLIAPEEFQEAFKTQAADPGIVWYLRALTGRDRSSKGTSSIQISQLELIITLAATHFPAAGTPSGGWCGDQNPWDASDFIRNLVNQVSADRSDQATKALQRLEQNPALLTYNNEVRHSLANQRALQRQSKYEQPDWSKTIAALSNREPANIADLQALLHGHLDDLNVDIGNRNNDIYKQFWNEDSHGRPTTPKPEESCGDVLLGMVRRRLQPLGVQVEPEGHMVADKRADISVALPGRKSLVELKRDTNPDVWKAHETQLEEFYARDPDASGHGTYGVFWFGPKRQGKIPARPDGGAAPKTAKQMEAALNSMIPANKRERLKAVVIDVSGPASGAAGQKKRKAKSKKKKKKPTERNHLRTRTQA
jgi:hypothetical protein